MDVEEINLWEQHRNRSVGEGADFQTATPDFFACGEIRECTECWCNTGPCHLCVGGQPILMDMDISLESIEHQSRTPSDIQSEWVATDFSTSIRCYGFRCLSSYMRIDTANFLVLVTCLLLTAHKWVTLMCWRSLKGLFRRRRLISWSLQLFALWGCSVLVVCRIIHFEGVHIQLEVVKNILWYPIGFMAVGVATRLNLRLRIDLLGKCRTLHSVRKTPAKVRSRRIKWKHLLFLCSFVTSHVTATAQTLGFDASFNDDDQGRADFGKEQFVLYEEQKHSASDSSVCLMQHDSDVGFDRATGEQQQLGLAIEHDTGQPPPNGEQVGLHSPLELESNRDGYALPEAQNPSMQSDSSFSRPCERSCPDRCLDQHPEGHSQSIVFLPNVSQNHTFEGREDHNSDRRTILGDFVFNPWTQDPSELKQGRTNHADRNRTQNFVFNTEPFEAKVWYAPKSECNGEARDITVEPDLFGNLQGVMCRVWSDKIRSDRCSFAIVRPQPAEHYHSNIMHFLTFELGSYMAVLVRQITSDSYDAARIDFCACAFSFRDHARTRLSLDEEQRWIKGQLVTFQNQRRDDICQVLSFGGSRGGENTATPNDASVLAVRRHRSQSGSSESQYSRYVWSGIQYFPARANTATQTSRENSPNSLEDHSMLMQIGDIQGTTADTRSTGAAQSQLPLQNIASFATQNFVKRDDLKTWIRNLPFYEEADITVLAIWRMRPTQLVTNECERLPLQDGNWAKIFRAHWRVSDEYTTPKLAAVEPQPDRNSHADFQQIHIFAFENRAIQPDHRVHLFDVWRIDDAGNCGRRVFLARKAAQISSTLAVERIPEILDLGLPRLAEEVYASSKHQEGRPRVILQGKQTLALPEYSQVDIMIVTNPTPCACGEDEQRFIQEARDNTATLFEEGDDSVVWMQSNHRPRTSAEIAAERCFDPVRTPIRLYRGMESSWRLWNHFVYDRAWSHANLDEVSVWILPERAFVQSIPVTLYSSRRGSVTTNNPTELWKSLGGESDPIVLMVFPTPSRIVLPEDHLVMMPYEAYDQGQRVFLIDVVSDSVERPVLERVAVRGTRLTPRRVAQELGYNCAACSVRYGRCPNVFLRDQEIWVSTGSYVTLDISDHKDSQAPCELELAHRVAPVHDMNSDEVGLFQFEPPPRMNPHGDSERYFWVRNTVVFLPAVSIALLEIGYQATGHWPLTVVYFQDLPHETRTFGFTNHDLVNLDEYRVRFRELYVDQFRTDETVSIGLVDVNLLQNQRVQMHELELIAFRNRVPFQAKPVLVCIRYVDGGTPITPKAVLFPRAVTKQDVIESVLFVRECGSFGEQCLASTAAGLTIGQVPVRIDSWQRIFLDVLPVQERALECTGPEDEEPANTSGGRFMQHDTEDVNLMQTSIVPEFRPGLLEMYAFSIADRFIGSAPEEQVWVSTYCHLWTDRDHPGRNHRPIVATRGQLIKEALLRIWSPQISRENIVVTPVRPMPEIGVGLRPAVIVTDYEDERTIPVLFDYTSDERTFMGTGLIGCHFGFPDVHGLFDLLIPGNLCRTVTSCLVRAHGRQFVPGQTVMIFAGLFLKLDEQDLEETTSENVTSTDYGVVMSRASTTGLSSDASLQPGPPNSDTDRQEMGGQFPALNLPGPFFDWNQEGELYAIGYELSPDASMLWFQVIAVQRTEFQQVDQMLGDTAQEAHALDRNGLIAFVVVNNEWNEVRFMAHVESSADPTVLLGNFRQTLLDEFPVHVPLSFWLVQPNLLPEEQDHEHNRYVLVDFACPDDERGVIVLIQDPEEVDLDRQAVRVRPQMTNLLLFVRVGKTVKCTSEDFDCSVEHDGQILPRGAYWPTFHGMKLIVRIVGVSAREKAVRMQQRVCSWRSSVEGSEADLDYTSFMHLFSEVEMAVTEDTQVDDVPSASSHHGLLMVHSSSTSDVLRAYIHSRKGVSPHEAFTVYVWMLSMPLVKVVHIAQRCPMFKRKSYTEAIQHLWAVTFAPQPLAVTLVHPDLQPLSLRAAPIDLLVVPEADLSQGRKAYLVDVIGMPLPRRLALYVDSSTTVRHIADLAGARLICELPTTSCVIRSAIPDNRKEWSFHETVDVEHGTSLALWIQPVRRDFERVAQLCIDETGFMQLTRNMEFSREDIAYFHEAVEVGFMHLWIHDSERSELTQSQHRRVAWPNLRSSTELRTAVWTDRVGHRKWNFQRVEPAPMAQSSRQPTIIFYPTPMTEQWPILVKIDNGVELALVTMLLPAHNAPYSVDFVFDRALPQHACRETSQCTALVYDVVYRFWVDLPLQPGLYFKIFEEPASEQGSTTTCDSPLEESEESTRTEDDEVDFTQLDLSTFRFVRCPETNWPLSTHLQREGVTDLDRHWQLFEEEMFEKTTWHRAQQFQMEVQAVAPLNDRGIRVLLLWFGRTDPYRKIDVGWQEVWSSQVGMLQARAEIRLRLWESVPPSSDYIIGTAHPQPTTRQQNERDDLYLVGQLEDDDEVAVLLVVNYLKDDIDRFTISAVKTSVLCSREQILIDTAMTGMCELVRCIVSSDHQVWPPAVQFPLAIGKRIDIEIRFDESIPQCEGDFELSEEEPSDDDDLIVLEEEGEENLLFEERRFFRSSVSMALREASPLASASSNSAHAIKEMPRDNTATLVLATYDETSEEGDDANFMQNDERLRMDDGDGLTSPERLQRCVEENLAWMEPLRMRPREMQNCWQFPGVDYLRHHFSGQGLTSPSFRIEGWLFRDFRQQEGSPFAWGIGPRAPWHEQISHLLKGSGIAEGLAFTVIPQPTELSLTSSQPATMQVITPFQFDMPLILILVLEYAFDSPPVQRAVLCHPPCTVYTVFVLLGLDTWCDDRHHCGASYRHGKCGMYFQDLDVIRVPTASRLTLVLTNKARRSCEDNDLPQKAMQAAMQIANRLHTPGTPSHHRAFKNARAVLMHQPTDSSDEEDTNVMLQLELDWSGMGASSQERILASIQEDKQDETAFMQRPGAPEAWTGSASSDSFPSTMEAAGTEAVSSLSSVPLQVGPQPNREYDWLQSWQHVRHHVTDYCQAVGRRTMAGELFIHLIVCRQEESTNHGISCPDRFLTASSPIHHFVQYLQHFAFPFDMEHTRAFPATVELHQNIPSIVIVDAMGRNRRPMIVQMITELESQVFVYQAAPIERIAGIVWWLRQRAVILTPIETFLNNARVFGGDDMPIYAGDVFRVRVLSQHELNFPTNSTGEPTNEQSFVSHNTWSTLDPGVISGGSLDRAITEDAPEYTLEQLMEDNGIHDEHALVQSSCLILTSILPATGNQEGNVVHSWFEVQIEDLTWFPESDGDWITMVVRREMARAQWGLGSYILILRPAEPLVDIPLEARAYGEAPDPFDLSGLLWTQWPDLNYVRFRIFEATSQYQVGRSSDMTTLAIRPHRWGNSPDMIVVIVEVVRLQWSSILSRSTAHMMHSGTTPSQLVRSANVRDCTVFFCEVRHEGELVWPEAELTLVNGALVTVLVKDANEQPGSFRLTSIQEANQWDTRRWQSQEQPFRQRGTILVFRPAPKGFSARWSVRLPVQAWHTWEIVKHKIRKHWNEFALAPIGHYSAHDVWRTMEEFESFVAVAILKEPPMMFARPVILVLCRDSGEQTSHYWAQEWHSAIDERDVVTLCGQAEQCQLATSECDARHNDRSLRFVQRIEITHGDIVTLQVRKRDPFCHDVQGHARPVRIRRRESDDTTVSLLQLAAVRRTKQWTKPCTAGLRPPGNTTFWFVERLNTMSTCVFKEDHTFVIDEVPRQGKKISIADHLGIGPSRRPIPTPARSTRMPVRDAAQYRVPLMTSQDISACLDFGDSDKSMIDIKQLPLTEEVKAALARIPVYTWDEDLVYSDAIELYTDGSFDGSHAGWAAAIIFHRNSTWGLLGVLSGSVVHGSSTTFGVGIPSLSAQVAEQAALIWSHWWILRFARTFGWQGQVYFRWDAIVPGKQALGDFQTSTPLGHLLRALAFALEQQQGDRHIYHAHVRAHKGILLNEVVDTAAKAARSQMPIAPDRGKLSELVHRLPNLHQLWWVFCSHAYQQQLPKFDRTANELRWSPTANQATQVTGIQQGIQFGHAEHQAQPVTCNLRCASYNVLSLMDPAPPPLNRETGRARLLREQANAKAIHLLGLQECRSPQGTIRSSSHLRLCSGATEQGTLGVELWISLRVPVDQQQPFDARDFAVAFADPQCLIVKYTGVFGHLLIIVAHAPHSGHPESVRAQWWGKLGEQIDKHQQDAIPLILIDANAVWAGPPTASLGDLVETRPNANTPYFQGFVEKHRLFAPATFSEAQWGPWFTWVHAGSGKEHRLDYVLLDVLWSKAWIEAWTDLELSTGHPGWDHIATVVDVYWEQGYQTQQKKIRLDAMAMMDPSNKAKIFDILDRCPQPAWSTNASDHAVQLTQYFQQELGKHFPAPRRKTPEFTQNDTREVYSLLVANKRALRQFRLIERYQVLYLAFSTWAKKFAYCGSNTWTIAFNQKYAQLAAQTSKLASKLKVCLRQDRNHFLSKVAQEVSECPPAEVYRKLRPVLRPTKKQTTVLRPLPKLLDTEGQPIMSRAAQNQRWTSHFASIEAGKTIQVGQFVHEHLQRQMDRCKPTSYDPEDIPSLFVVESAIRAATAGKATGPDGLPVELFKAIPGKASKILYPLALKLALRIEEPLTWKGGHLFALYKGKGSTAECSSHRGILLMNVMGKITRASLRKWINEPYLVAGHSMQLGGKPHQQAQFGAQLTRSFLRWCKSNNKSAAVLFVDIASAFYKALREIATGADTSDQDIAQIVKRLGLGPEVMPALSEALQGRTAYAALTESVPRQQVLQESLQATWFSVDGEAVVGTEQGTRPGDSWADVVFNVLLSQVLQKVQRILEKSSLVTLVAKYDRTICPNKPTGGATMPLLQVTWADDIALMITVDKPQMIWSTLPRVMQVLVDELHAIGMEISCGPTKTAALVLLRGPGSVQTRRRMFQNAQSELPVLTEKEGLKLPLVPQYKHLGGILTFKGTLAAEISMRFAKARQAYWRSAKAIFRQRHVADKVKAQLFQALVMTVYIWGIGAWPAMSKADMKHFQTSYWNLQRLRAPRQDGKISNETLCRTLDCPCPVDLLQAARARHYVTMLLHAPDPVWTAAHLDQPTAEMYRNAIEWVYTALQRERGFCNTTPSQACQLLCALSPKRWKSTVRRAAERWRLYRLREQQVTRSHQQVLNALTRCSLCTQGTRAHEWKHFCLLCKKGFDRKNAWFLHVVHAYKTMEGEAVTGTTCWCCAKQYPTSASLKNHLRYSRACCTYFWKNHEHLQDQAGAATKHPQFPWTRVRSTEQVPPAPIQRDEALFRSDLQEALRDFAPPEDESRFVAALADTLTTVAYRVMPIDDILNVLRIWALDFVEVEQSTIREAIEQTIHEVSCTRLKDNIDNTLSESLEREDDRAKIQVMRASPQVPSTFPEMYVLHFFSGRRRTNDLQQALEHLTIPNDAVLFVISLDVMVSADHGNLTDVGQQTAILKLIRLGMIAAIYAGPPCETWTLARFQPVEGCKHPPRPLRSKQEPWGFVHVSLREGQQLAVGNQLMCFALHSILELALVGGLAILEHPCNPHDLHTKHQQAPSIWETVIVDWLRKTGLFHSLTLFQGNFGAKSPKPTTFFIAGLSHETTATLEKRSRTTVCPTSTTIGLCGKDWATSSLKEYPPDLCNFLARLFESWLKGANMKSGPPPENADWLKAMHITEVGNVQKEGPDFHPSLIKNLSS